MAGIFELETGLDYSNLSALRSRVESLKSTVSSWIMHNEDPGTIDKDLGDGCNVQESEGWTVEMDQEKESVVADLEMCAQRIGYIIDALDCVIQNHQGLQDSFKFSQPGVRRYNKDGSLTGLNCDYNQLGSYSNNKTN